MPFITDPNALPRPLPQPGPSRPPSSRPRRSPASQPGTRRARTGVRTAAQRAANRSAREAAKRATIGRAGTTTLGRLGGLWGGAGIFVLEKIIERIFEMQDEEIDAQLEAQHAQIEEKLRRRAKEKILRTTELPDYTGATVPTVPAPDSPATTEVLPVPSSRIELPADDPFEIEFPSPEPITFPAPVPGPIVAPDAPASPGSPAPLNKPFPIPDTVVTPVFNPGLQPKPIPITNPFANPFADPSFNPYGNPRPGFIGDPQHLAQPKDQPRRLTEIDPDVLDFPNPQPQAETNPRRRCKPCKEDNPQPRDTCYKGLYREGRMDTEVDYVEWAEINCETGVEI